MVWEAAVSGEVYRKEAGGKVIDRYEAVFVLPDVVECKNAALSIIQGAMLKSYLAKNVPQFVSWRTCSLDSYTKAEGDASASSGLAAAAVEAVQLGCLPETIDLYKDDAAKEKAIKGAIATRKKRNAEADKKAKINELMAQIGQIQG